MVVMVNEYIFAIGKDQKKLEVIMDVVVVDKVVEEVNKVVEEVNKELVMDVVVVDKVVEKVNKVVKEVSKKLLKEYNIFFRFYKVKL